ncbi:MAG: tetratricopeptide repeat protein [Candidatus Hodarchaeota archaeon]
MSFKDTAGLPSKVTQLFCSGVNIMKTSAQIFLLAVLILSCTVSTFAQEPLWKELTTKVRMLRQQGRYSEAAKVAEEALSVAEKTFGPDHPAVAVSLNNLALVYQTQGRYSDAEPLFKRLLKIVEKALGLHHPDVAVTCENMTSLYRQIDKEDEAERLEARARRIRSNQ